MNKRIWLFPLIGFLILGGLALQPARAQGALGPGFYHDDFYFLTYTGTWSLAFNANLIGGESHTTLVMGDSVSFSFWGDGVSLYTVIGPSEQDIDVCIDSICTVVSRFNGSVVFAAAIDFLSLGYGTHTISVARAASGGNIHIDGFLVHPPAPQPTLAPQEIVVTVDVNLSGEITPEPYIDIFDLTDSDGNTQTVSFSRQMDAGQVFNGIVDVGVLFVALIAFGFWMWRTRGATKDE